MRKQRRIGWYVVVGLTVFGFGAFALALRDSGAQAPASDPFPTAARAIAEADTAATPSAATPAGNRVRFPSSSGAVVQAGGSSPYAAPSPRDVENPIRQAAGEAPPSASSAGASPLGAAPSVTIPTTPTPAAMPTSALPANPLPSSPPSTALPVSPPSTAGSRYATSPYTAAAAPTVAPSSVPPQTLPVGSAVGAQSIPPTAPVTTSLPAASSPYAAAPSPPPAASSLSPYPAKPVPAAPAASVSPVTPPPTTAALSPRTAPVAVPQPFANEGSPRPQAVASEGVGRPGEKALEGLQQPTLLIEKLAPQEIQVGKPALFELHVRNAGQTTAHEVEVRDLVPQGTYLLSTKPQAQTGPRGDVVWALGSLRPGDEAVLSLELMPTTEGEIGSTATVRFASAASARSLCTKPELAIDVQAPRNAQVGDDVPLRIRISNPGSGVATGVLLTEVVPANMAHEGGPELEYEVGDLQPGESRDLELVLRAMKPGQALNLLHAKGAGKLATEAKTPIEIVAPALALEIEGPKKRYLDRQATYTVSIANPGTAAAREVELATYLPRGLQFVDANNNGEYDATTHSVRWLLEELPPRERGSVTVTTLPVEPGQQLLRIESSADRGVTAQKEEAVLVEGVASVAFQVVDTADPIEVGGETTYEIVVSNQGTKEATNIQLAASLPEGLKVVDADGPTRFTSNGKQVQFAVLPQLPPKGETIYRVRVQCLAAGDHRCHVQLMTDDMRTPVTKEEGTRSYAEE